MQGLYKYLYRPWVCVVSGHETSGQVAKLNTDLAFALTTRGKEPQVSVQHVDMAQLEGVLAREMVYESFFSASLLPTTWVRGQADGRPIV